ncbi:hypothetical protein K4G60_g2244 [Candida parapsilosis]|nr:hypothetical protein K4G60_g2244 [Candida parapsilosis]KAI5906947.1 hypothetical protein K4G61_g607 [Candida parapsilosis]CAD1812089.1 unnamed protein product [Candida parapsilosis]
MSNMTTVPVYQQLRPDANYTYKLIQLPPNIISHLSDSSTSNAKYLNLKTKPTVATATTTTSDDGDDNDAVVVCTGDSTFKLRQNNHSNCVLLMNQRPINNNIHQHQQQQQQDGSDENALLGFSQCNYVYELTQIPGTILDVVPEYHAENEQRNKNLMTKTEMAELSPCSSAEFEKIYIDLCLCEIATGNNKFVYRLSFDTISQILHTLITYLISESKHGQNFTIFDLNLQDNQAFQNWQLSMINAVIHKFTTPDQEPSNSQDGNTVVNGVDDDNTTTTSLRLNDDAITHWFGIQELSKLNYNAVPLTTVADFLLNWKTALPSFYNVPLDIIQLQGHYYTTSSTGASPLIHFIDQSSLSRDVSTRFKQLLQLQPNWKYNEFVACLQPVLDHAKKVDSVILKYGKKKRVKRDQFIVCAR